MKTDVLLPTLKPIEIDPHYPPAFYAGWWGISASTVLRWFQDRNDVLKVGKPTKNGKRARVEIMIPLSVAVQVYKERCRA